MVGRQYVPSFFLRALLTGPSKISDASREEERPMPNKMWDWISKRRIELILFFAGIAGIAIGATIGEWSKIPAGWEEETRTGVVALGTALLIAGFLALTVDTKLKKGIAEEAFGSVMGWVTPPRLKAELDKIYKTPLFAVEHHMIVNLSEISNGITRMTLDIERNMKNESLHNEDYTPSLDVRKWEPSRESGITDISAFFRNKQYNKTETTEHPDKDATDIVRKSITEPIKLEPDEEIRVFYKGYEDKLESDAHWEVFGSPTENPTVTVVHPASMNVYVQFASSGDKIHERELRTGNEVTDQWRLNGVMLPSQPIVIRWWPTKYN